MNRTLMVVGSVFVGLNFQAGLVVAHASHEGMSDAQAVELFNRANDLDRTTLDQDGPNCFGTALWMTGREEELKHFTPREFSDSLSHHPKKEECLPLWPEAKLLAGDIIVFHHPSGLRRSDARPFHAAVYLGGGLVFAKRGKAARDRFQIDWLLTAAERYGISQNVLAEDGEWRQNDIGTEWVWDHGNTRTNRGRRFFRGWRCP